MDRRRLLPRLGLAAVALALAAPLPGQAAAGPNVIYQDDYAYGFQGEGTVYLHDFDGIPERVTPSAAQRAALRRLGAKAYWHDNGTPRTLYKPARYLSGPRAGAAVDVARHFVTENATLLGLTKELTSPRHLKVLADNPLYEAPDRRRMMAGQKPLTSPDDVAHVVLFRQDFNGLYAGLGGLLHVTTDPDGRIVQVSSSVTGATTILGEWKLGAQRAILAAAKNAKMDIAPADLQLAQVTDHIGATAYRLAGAEELQRARRVVMPIPGVGVRKAWEVMLSDAVHMDGEHPQAYTSYVDAETGRVLARNNDVDHLGGGVPAYSVLPQVPDPKWKEFGQSPQFPLPGEASPDDRLMFCWVVATGCNINAGHNGALRDVGSPHPYDVLPADASNGSPTFTSQGNNAWTTSSYASHLTPDSPRANTPSPTRVYDYAFTDQWHTSNCNLSGNYASPAQNDIDASISNLFFGHNRMHDWSYFLGFVESTWNMQQVNFGEDHPDSDEARAGDPEKGQAQAGAVAGSVVFTGRDNANQITQADGTPGVTNQYLWHPLQAGFYSPCVDGAYDMSVIGHEYTHATSNRMIGGPNQGISGNEGGSMGESWSDLSAVEYGIGYGFVPVADENPFAVGPYATGSKHRGIRNYGMNDSPLNYGNLGYDGNGTTSPHADGEIWSATQYSVRQALVEKWDAQFPHTDKTLQFECADGIKDSTECPGNRRWVQLLYDAFLIQEAGASMAEAAVANMSADLARYGGANQTAMWTAYASRGMGDGAEGGGTVSWRTPDTLVEPVNEATVQFQAIPVGTGGVPGETKVFVGRYEARITESAISAAGAPSAEVQMVPGTYEFIASAEGYGHLRFSATFTPGQKVVLKLPMRKNLASVAHGAEAAGDGANLEFINDDTEGTNWAFLGASAEEEIEGKQVTVALAGGKQLVREVAVSAANRPQEANNAGDGLAQSRFAALRSFELLSCDDTTGSACEEEGEFTKFYTSAEDAFPSDRPRPLAPNLQIQTFDVPDTSMTHLRIRVLTNQCTGNSVYTVEENPVGEPLSNPDCQNGFTAAKLTSPGGDPNDVVNNTQRHRVRIAEVQAYGEVTPQVLGGGTVAPPPPPGPQPPPPPPPPAPNPPGPLPATGTDPLPFIAAALLAGAAAVVLRSQRSF